MAVVTSALVKELRERTGVGMMECKKALEEAGGDLEAAISIMRKSGQAKAAKKLGRVAAEGAVAIKKSSDSKRAVIVEVNCETDFAARDPNFLEFVDVLTTGALEQHIADYATLLNAKLTSGQSIAALREALVAKIGENINIRRMQVLAVSGDGIIGSYIHGNARIGVIVGISTNDAELAKDLAMHIAASNPIALTPEEFPSEILSKEKEFCLAELQGSDKPKEILEKIVAGRMQKLVNEAVLLKQPFVKNPDTTIESLLKQAKSQVSSFVRFEVGEGIEKKETDFASEVHAQLESRK